MALSDRSDKPDVEMLVARAAALVPELRERAADVDRDGAVSKDIVQKLHDAGLYRISRPARFGGYESDYRVLFRVIMELARGCGSTAWVFGNTSTQQINTSMFSLEAQTDFWGENPETLISGSYAPTGKAQKVEGGYRLNGTWGFASGVDHAAWHLVGAILPSESDGPPALNFLVVPRSDYRIIDNWDTVGLRGTGSKDVAIEDAFVPAHRILPAAAMLSGDTPGSKIYDNPMLKLPFLTFAAASFVAPALGMVQDGIEAFLDMARVRSTRGALAGGGNRLAEFAAVQSRLAEASGLLDAAKLLILRDLDETIAAAAAGRDVTVAMRIRNRRNQSLAARFCAQAIEALFACSGGAGLYMDNRIQRLWRDITAVSKHISLNWDAVSTMYGQHALGLEPKGQY